MIRSDIAMVVSAKAAVGVSRSIYLVSNTVPFGLVVRANRFYIQ